jgi:D-sedoheptulose 7-phosphate isomerase
MILLQLELILTQGDTDLKPDHNPLEYLHQTSEESQAIHQKFLKEHATDLIQAAQWLGQSIRAGGKILIIGNGGSAADAQHMAAEMVGKMLVDRKPLPAIALTTDTSNLTALANDFGYDHVFEKQILALGRKGDVVIGISTSGNSKNVLQGLDAAKKMGCKTIGITGGGGGKLKSHVDLCLNASQGKNSSRIQETHIFAIHSMVDLLDRYFLEGNE